MKLCIVDTSVFVDFFRGKPSASFEYLLKNNLVCLSSYVRLELLMGVRKNERPKLERHLRGLIRIVDSPDVFRVAEVLLAEVRTKGMTIGTVYLLIGAQSRLTNYPVFSRDKIFNMMASTDTIKVWSGL